MIKKFLCLLLAVTILIFISYLYLGKATLEKTCAFCDPVVLKRQTFYEDDLVLALYTHKPILPGHSLIISKRHVERFENLTDAEILRIGQVIKKVNVAVQKVFHTSSYLLLQKNGSEVGQTVPHVHFHYIPRKANENSMLPFLFKFAITPYFPPISNEEMLKTVETLKGAMGS